MEKENSGACPTCVPRDPYHSSLNFGGEDNAIDYGIYRMVSFQ